MPRVIINHNTELPGKYPEIEAHIKEAIEKLRNCAKPNVAAVAQKTKYPSRNWEFDGMDASRGRTGLQLVEGLPRAGSVSITRSD